MDINFTCAHCQQELSVDSSMSGIEIECPACHGNLSIPGEAEAPPSAADPAFPVEGTTTLGSGAPRMAISLGSGTSPTLIQKPSGMRLNKAAAADLKIFCRTFMREDYDSTEAFDNAVTEFLSEISEHTIKGTHAVQSGSNYGLIIIHDNA
ncbi:hypothetical protein N9059_01350 [bacterium]|nr:hypothetical protein [bacterium]